jgi:hypothetical protein
MSYINIVICIGSLPILETWPPIYRGQERTVWDRLRVSKSSTYVYFRYTPCLTDFTFEFIRRPTPPILSPSSRTFVEFTLVSLWPLTTENFQHWSSVKGRDEPHWSHEFSNKCMCQKIDEKGLKQYRHKWKIGELRLAELRIAGILVNVWTFLCRGH